MRALGARYRSSALAQEKTGEAFVDAQLYGGHTRGEYEHAEVAVFVGKNPWQSQSFPRARVVLRQLSRDPGRCLIVIDPVRTETAELADIHLRVRPGTDAWCLAAMLGVIVQNGLFDDSFLAEHTRGCEDVLAALADVPIAAFSTRCGVGADPRGSAPDRAGRERGDVRGSRHPAGAQQRPLLVPGQAPLAADGELRQAGRDALALLAGAAVPPRSRRAADSGHGRTNPGRPDPVQRDRRGDPDRPSRRLRAMLIESSNPAHSLAGSKRFRDALHALELVVVIDVAMTETARHADYVLPAASQFEKWEATFFNLEFPRNSFHLRAPLMEPLAGTLPEPEIYARLMRSLGVVDEPALAPLREAAAAGRAGVAQARRDG